MKNQIEFWLDLFVRREISYAVLVKQLTRIIVLAFAVGVILGGVVSYGIR